MTTLVGRGAELRRLKEAIKKRKSQLTWGLADSIRDSSIVEMEIEQVPMENEPEKSHAANCKQRIPHFVPHPLASIAPRFHGSVNSSQSSNSRQHADYLKQMDPFIEIVSQCGDVA